MIPFKDYIEEGKRGLWDNIHAKRERIKNGSGEKMRNPGSKGAPTAADFKASQTKEEVELDESYDKNSKAHAMAAKLTRNSKASRPEYHSDGSASIHHKALPDVSSATLADATLRDVGGIHNHSEAELKNHKQKVNGLTLHVKKTNSGHTTHISEAANSAQQAAIAIAMKKAGKKPHNEEVDAQFDLIEDMVMAIAEQHNLDPEMVWEKFEDVSDTELLEAAVDAKGYKSSTGGLTQKGRDHYNNTEGGNLKAPVTTPPSKLKAGSKAANRRKSFCARMSGVDGPMKKPNGEPTRKALALRKWNC